MKCPKCGKVANAVKCNSCGDERCNNSGPGGCGASSGPFGKTGEGGSVQATCKECKKGRYEKL